MCHILKGLEDIVAHPRYENWLFLFGTIVASEDLPAEDPFDYQFFNFAPLYKGYDPSTSSGAGKKFVVPKRYVSQIDFRRPCAICGTRRSRWSSSIATIASTWGT